MESLSPKTFESQTEKWKINNPDNLTAREVLREVGRLSSELFGGKHPAVPEMGLADGTFAGNGELDLDSDGNVVLRRFADHEEHLIKGWVQVGAQELIDTSLYSGGGKGLPTSARRDWNKSTFTDDAVMGIFCIPVKNFLEMIKNGDAVLGNIGEGEIVLNPRAAEPFLTTIEKRNESL